MTLDPRQGQTRQDPGQTNLNTNLLRDNRSGLVSTRVGPQGFGGYVTANAQAVTVVVSSGGGGTGYSPADTITLTGGTCSAAVVLTVATTTSGGAVATVTISTGGSYSLINPTSAATQATSSGAGVSAKFNVTWGLQAATVSSAGAMYAGRISVAVTSTAATATGYALGTPTMKAVATPAPIVVANGSGYAPSDTITLTGGTCATATVLSITTTKMVSVSIGTNAGTGYAVGEVVSLSGGTSTVGAQITVTGTTSGGAVATINISRNGNYSSQSATPTQGTTSGAGTNLTFINACYGCLVVSISTAGSYTVLPSQAVVQGTTSGTGTNAAFLVSYGINTVPLGTAGSGFTSTVGLIGINTVTATGQGATGATTTEDDLLTYTLLGGALQRVGDTVFIFADGVVGPNGNTKTIKSYFGSRSFSLGASTSNGVTWWTQTEATLMGANVVKLLSTGQIGGAAVNPQLTYDPIIAGAEQTIRVTGTNGLAQAGDCIAATLTVEFEG